VRHAAPRRANKNRLAFPFKSDTQPAVGISDWMEGRFRESEAVRPNRMFSRVANAAVVAAVALRERAIPYWPIDAIQTLQRRRIGAMVVHAYETVPFYRKTMDERGLKPGDIQTSEDLGRLPLIDGTDLTEEPMRFVSVPFQRAGREVFKTSGSTSGLRKPIFWDHASLLLRAARGERDRVVIAQLAGERWGAVVIRECLTNELRHSLARLLGVDTEGHRRLLILPADFSSRTQRVVWNERSVIPRKPVHYHHLPPSVAFPVAAAHIAAIRPNVVLSFGSYADQFFRYLVASQKSVPMPRLWMYISDRLSPEGREFAEQMGSTVYSVYGAMEAGTIGFQCEQRKGFHLNIDLCAVRIVDDDGHAVPDGTSGNVVNTPLDNRAMALINYSVGDRGALSTGACPCGRSLPVLDRLEGRRSEMVDLVDGRKLSSLTIEGLFSQELRSTIQAQIEQDAPGSLHWKIVPFSGTDRAALREAMISRGRQVLGSGTMITVTFVEEIARTSAGKFLRAVRTAHRKA
jgi:phenylacetate-CoA ligase